MGRKERPIASSRNLALIRLAQWLRDQRAASGCSYAELAARVNCHATTLQRAASGKSVPSEQSVRAYAEACEAPVDVAVKLWLQARSPSTAKGSPNPEDIDGIDALQAGLRELHEIAGRPSFHRMEKRAGEGQLQLPHSTAHRIVNSMTVPGDAHQLTGFLTACGVAVGEHPPWIAAWKRALQPPPIEASRPAAPASALRFAVLGPVRAWSADQPLDTGPPKQRALLAVLLLSAGRIASAERLIDALWGDEPPPLARAALRTYVSRIRRALGPGVLISESGGYTIPLPAQDLDLTHAQGLCTQAEKAHAAGDLHMARSLLQQALNQWASEALTGLPGPYAAAERRRLEEWRLQILQACLEMDLMLGCHGQVVSELIALTVRRPFDERLRALLMLALYRSDRQADALNLYAETRKMLSEELGVDPGQELAKIYELILRNDPALQDDPTQGRRAHAFPLSGFTTGWL
jgi:DNA-binding SARP family transcriptional activator/transcriptional regulator with XRE-family HTH domain